MSSSKPRTNPLGFVPYILKQVTRHRVRSILTILGIATAMFLYTAVQAMQRGVTIATTQTANDTTLVVYRKDRFCPATSTLPQNYTSRIERMEGVVSVIPMKIVVTNCRTSLDVVTFRGVPKETFLGDRGDSVRLVAGSIDDWVRRGDATLLGRTLADRRGLRPGMTFDAAGITSYVAGIIESDNAQDQNVAYAGLEFVQLAASTGLGSVTQYNVRVADASLLDPIAEAIDAEFSRAQEPTATFTEKAFIGRIADDIIELVGFANWLGIGCLAAVLALIANAIVLSVQSRIAEHAVLQTLGFSSRLVAMLIVGEGVLLAIIGGALGGVAAVGVAKYSSLALSVEGTTIPIQASPALVATGLLVCGTLGVVAGLFPAWQAGRREIASCFRSV
ncbi:MAG: FtsX-like permease family protein [Phycisphaerales bacterium]|nr:FtsX-like permease family protein [Phycisphaerales bacterium]